MAVKRGAMRQPAAMLPLFLVSMAVVGFEIALTRYFAVAKWSEYGYWVISIVLAGFALSGVAIALAQPWFARRGAALLAALPAAMIVAAALGYHAVAANPFNPLQLQNAATFWSQIGNIGVYYADLLPFFFLGGVFVSLSFVLNATQIGRVYGFDLAGAGAGAVLVLALMLLVHPFRLAACLLVPLALAAAGAPRWRLLAVAAAALALVGGEALLLFDDPAAYNDFKAIYAPLHVPQHRTLAEIRSPRGLYALLDDFTERLDTDVSNDAAMLGLPGPPQTYGLYRDGTRIAALPKASGLEARYAGATLAALPYSLLAHPRVLLAGASGGFRIAEAQKLGAARVDVSEPEPVLRRAIQAGLAASPPMPADPAVRLHASGPLALARGLGPFDLVDLSADFLDAAEANATAFTAEALASDLRALAPGGLLSVPVSIREFPAYALRVLATVRAALLRAGVADPARHVIVYRSAWNVRILASMAPFDPARIAAARAFCDQRSFDLSYYPGIDVAAARAGIYNDLPAVSFGEGAVTSGGDSAHDAIADEAGGVLAGEAVASGRDFDLSPMTFDRPAFYALLRLDHLGTILRRLELLPQAEIGPLVNLAVLAQAAVIALLVLAVPLAAGRRLRATRLGLGRTVVYFAALGVGFLFIEIFAIERASFYLDDRTSGFALVLTAMLICSGAGAMLSQRFADRPERGLLLAAGVVAAWSVAALAALQPAMLATLAWPWPVRAGLVLLAVAPVSLALGLPFPLGLGRASDAGGGFLPWAWGLNGAFSVVATPLANLVALQFGYRAVLLGALVLYVLAIPCFPRLRKNVTWQQNLAQDTPAA